jgi:hypothetical protein
VLILRGAQQGHFRHGKVYLIMRFGVWLVLKINLHVKKKKTLIALRIFVASNIYAQYFNFNSCIPWPLF